MGDSTRTYEFSFTLDGTNNIGLLLGEIDPKGFIPPCLGNACPECKGKGWVKHTSTAETKVWLEVKCPKCKGRGFV